MFLSIFNINSKLLTIGKYGNYFRFGVYFSLCGLFLINTPSVINAPHAQRPLRLSLIYFLLSNTEIEWYEII